MTDTKKVASIPSYRSTGFDYTINKPLRYPLITASDHFIRFFINLDEESSYIKDSKVTVLGDVDQSDQRRLRRVPLDQSKANTAAAIAVGVKSAATVAGAKNLSALKGFKGNAIRTGLGIGAGVIGGTVAYLAADQLKMDKKLKRLSTTITLYTPAGISESQTTHWDNFSDLTADILQQVSDPNVANSVKSVGSIAAAVTKTVALGASDMLQSATRTAVNPKKDLLFKFVDRRSFAFNFVFAPKSADEAIEVANIIHCFKLFSAPEVIEGTMEYLYTYPAEFDIEYGFTENGQESQNKFLNKISSCVLTSINIEYAPNGNFQTLEAGEPVQCIMSLGFQELEIMDRSRIVKGY